MRISATVVDTNMSMEADSFLPAAVTVAHNRGGFGDWERRRTTDSACVHSWAVTVVSVTAAEIMPEL